MSKTETLPSPDGVPLFGNGIEFLRDPLGAMRSWASEGDLVRLDIPGQNLHMVTEPSIIEEILERKHDKFTIAEQQRDTFAGVQEKSLQRSTGDRWKRQREALQAGFARENIEMYGDRMVAETEAWVEAREDGERIDLYRQMQLLSLSILSETLVDVDLSGNEDLVIDAAQAVIDRGDLRSVGQLVPNWVPTPFRRRFKRTLGALDEFVGESVTQRHAAEDGDDAGSILLAAHERGDLSLDEVRRNLMSLLLVGHTSPAVTFTYAWHLLTQHPEAYDALVAEYDEVVGDGRPSMETFARLDVTRNVVAETLRLYPTLFMVMRQATEPVTVDGHEFSAGAEFILPQWVLHRDERFWDDPESFDPSRWRRDVDRPDYAYFPFSGGPRHCIAMSFSRVILALSLATMAGRVKLNTSVDGPLELKPSLTLKPTNDITATVRRR